MKATQTTTLYFYKGTTFPIAVKEKGGERTFEKRIVKASLEMITNELKSGKSKAEIIKLYTEKLNEYEDTMFLVEKIYPKATDQERLDMVCERIGEKQDFAHSCWCLSINALLILKAIKNDNDNGLFVQVVYEPEPKKEEPKKEEPKKEEPKEENEEEIVFKGWKQEMIDGWSNVE